jgi:hypothetical protein
MANVLPIEKPVIFLPIEKPVIFLPIYIINIII